MLAPARPCTRAPAPLAPKQLHARGRLIVAAAVSRGPCSPDGGGGSHGAGAGAEQQGADSAAALWHVQHLRAAAGERLEHFVMQEDFQAAASARDELVKTKITRAGGR